MSRLWSQLAILGILGICTLGCRTPQPNLKPPKQPEELNVPPTEARYDSPTMPKEALVRDDPMKKLKDINNQAVMPTKGSGGMGMGPGGGMR